MSQIFAAVTGSTHYKNVRTHLSILILMVLLTGCSDAVHILDPVSVSYHPPFFPVKIVVSTSGIDVVGEAGIVTPIGSFSIGVAIPVVNMNRNDLILVLRNTETNTDSIYLIKNGRNARIVVDGSTTIYIGEKEVVVDITRARVVELLDSEGGAIATNFVVCESAAPSRLMIGMKAVVVWDRVNIRSTPQVPSKWGENIVTAISRNDVVTIVSGPACAHEGYWWSIETKTGIQGWMREATQDGVLLRPA